MSPRRTAGGAQRAAQGLMRAAPRAPCAPSAIAGANGGRLIRQSARAKVASIELSCRCAGTAPMRPSAPQDALRAEVVLAPVVGRRARARARPGSPAARGPARAARRSPRARTAPRRPRRRPGCPAGRASARRGCGRTSAACRAASRSARNRSRGRRSPSTLRTRSCSPTETPPSVTTQVDAGDAVGDAASASGSSARCRDRTGTPPQAVDQSGQRQRCSS